MKRITLFLAALTLATLPTFARADGHSRGGGWGHGGYGHGYYGGGHGYYGHGHGNYGFSLDLGFIFGGPRYDYYDSYYYRPVYRSYYPPPVSYYYDAPTYYAPAPVYIAPAPRCYDYYDRGYYYRPSGSISFSYSRYHYR